MGDTKYFPNSGKYLSSHLKCSLTSILNGNKEGKNIYKNQDLPDYLILKSGFLTNQKKGVTHVYQMHKHTFHRTCR